MSKVCSQQIEPNATFFSVPWIFKFQAVNYFHYFLLAQQGAKNKLELLFQFHLDPRHNLILFQINYTECFCNQNELNRAEPFHLPGTAIYSVLVDVIHQAILIASECFVSSMYINWFCRCTVNTAVSISTLNNCTLRLSHKPRVGLWTRSKTSFRRLFQHNIFCRILSAKENFRCCHFEKI